MCLFFGRLYCFLLSILYKFNIRTACFVDSLKFVCFYNKRKKKQIKKPGHLGIRPGCLKESSDKPVSNLNSDMKAKSKFILILFVYNLMIRLSLIRL